MVKLIGALCILIASGFIGMEISRSLAERTKQLRQFISALESLEAEILFGHAHLPEASMRISRQFDHPIGRIFQSFSENLESEETTAKEAWKKSLMEHWKSTALKTNELDILLQFGETLGRHDRYQQQKHIRLAVTHLERLEKESYQRQTTYGKIANNMGFLSGILLILLLL